MTRIDKSPEQWAAEAAVRRQDTPVGELIEDHRALYRADLRIPNLHQRDGDDAGLGVPFAHVFERFINWKDEDQEAGVRPSRPGIAFPWSQAFYAQWAECRRSHPEHHDRREWRGSLCYQLVSFTVRRNETLTNTCLILGVTVPRAGRTVRNALLWIESSMDHARHREEARVRDAHREPYKVYEPPKVSAERHDQGGIHAETCPKCLRKRRMDAA